VSQRINVCRLQEGLRTKRLGRNILFSKEASSTNKWAKELAELGAPEGTVAVAETQTAGRGRFGREWFSPKGGLWFSVVLRPRLKASEAVGLVSVVCEAVVEVLQELYGLKAEIKHPNDVLVNGRKICGILSKMRTTGESIEFVVVGVGVNANFKVKKVLPEELRKTATSIEDELDRKVRVAELFRALLEKIEKLYDLYVTERCASSGS